MVEGLLHPPPLENLTLNRFLYSIPNCIKYINFHENTRSEPGPDLDWTSWTQSEVDWVQVQVHGPQNLARPDPDLTTDSVNSTVY